MNDGHAKRSRTPEPQKDAALQDQAWPINEVLLAVQVNMGMTDEEIAATHGVDWQDVRSLRKLYEL